MTLSTHVLDAARGRPASGVDVRWESRDGTGTWQLTATGSTDGDGRITAGAWQVTGGPGHPAALPLVAGRHRLVFDIEAWTAREGGEAFFPEVVLTFAVTAARAGEHHHVPLLLSPYAYSTYRGS